MTRQTTLLLATLLLGVTACDQGEAPVADAKDAKPAAEAKIEAPAAPASPAADPAALADAPTVVASGLALGDRFAAFDIINCESGSQYCQVCQYGPSPKIMAVGTIDDEAFKKDLQDLEAMAAKYGEGGVKVFAVIAEAKDGALVTPVANKDALQAKAKALREELKLSFPVVIPAPRGDAPNGVFEDHYQVKQSRTIMLADGRNKVTYSEVAPKDYAGLDAAIKAVVDA